MISTNLLDPFLKLVLNPVITIDNYPVEWTEEFGSYNYKFQDIDTQILYNGYSNPLTYKSKLQAESDKIKKLIGDAKNSIQSPHNKNTINQIFLLLATPEFIKISYAYKIKNIAPEMKDLVELGGPGTLLNSMNELKIREFDIIGKEYYKLLYDFLKECYHQESIHMITQSKPLPILTKKEAIMGFCFENRIKEDLYDKIYRIWNKRIIEADYISFRMAFTKQLISTSSPVGIVWLLEHRNKPSHTALIYFLYCGLFEDIPDDKLFRKIVLATFVDKHHKPFKDKSFSTSLNDYNKRIEEIDKSNQPWKAILDDVIERTKLLTKYT